MNILKDCKGTRLLTHTLVFTRYIEMFTVFWILLMSRLVEPMIGEF